MFPILPGRHTSRCRPSAAACASWNRTALFCAKRTRLTGAKTLVRITPEGYAACARCEDALSDYFACVMARLTPEQVQQMNTLRGALMDAILAENASREAKNNEGRTEL